METVTVIKKEPTCAELVAQQWKDRQEDLKDPEYEALGFDYVEPHTWDNQPEGYWRWQFSWGGPSDELRGYVNEHGELHRLEYWYLDWGDGAHVLVAQDAEAWTAQGSGLPQSVTTTVEGRTVNVDCTTVPVRDFGFSTLKARHTGRGGDR